MAGARTGCGPSSRKTSNPSVASSARASGNRAASDPASEAIRRGILEAYGARDIRRGDFADADADGPARDDPPRFPQRRERHLEGELDGPIRRGVSDSGRGLIGDQLGRR